MLAVGGVLEDAVLTLSSMAVTDSQTVPLAADQPGSRAQKRKADVIDVASDYDPADGSPGDGEQCAGSTSFSSATAVMPSLPPKELVDKVLMGTTEMGLTLDREQAVRLLSKHHNNPSDAIGAAFS